MKTLLVIENEIKEFLKDQEVATDNFSISKMIEETGIHSSELLTWICNLEDEGIMEEIGNGNYENFDIDDSTQFNDGYLDIKWEIKQDKKAKKKLPKTYLIENENSGSGMSSRPSRYYYQEGTLEELIKAYGYTLDCGRSYQHEKGNKKIDCNPKSINSLIKNLNNAVNNSAANGYAGQNYSIVTERKQ